MYPGQVCVVEATYDTGEIYIDGVEPDRSHFNYNSELGSPEIISAGREDRLTIEMEF